MYSGEGRAGRLSCALRLCESMEPRVLDQTGGGDSVGMRLSGGVTSQFSSLLKEIQGNPLEHSPLSKSEIFSMEYSRIGNK